MYNHFMISTYFPLYLFHHNLYGYLSIDGHSSCLCFFFTELNDTIINKHLFMSFYRYHYRENFSMHWNFDSSCKNGLKISLTLVLS